MCKFRELTANEIECRVGMVRENGLTLLLYKDARVDMTLLDETVGSANWQREHYEVKGNLYCRVGIKLDGEWVWKSDCGTESNADAEKGESSDSFKRACVNWGIGRELYTAPFIWIGKDKCNIENKKCNDKFFVKNIVIQDKRIKEIEIWNKNKNCCAFVWRETNQAPQNPPVPFPEAEPISYEKALTMQYQGVALKDIYKQDRTTISQIYNDPNTPENIKAAIRVINAMINAMSNAHNKK